MKYRVFSYTSTVKIQRMILTEHDLRLSISMNTTCRLNLLQLKDDILQNIYHNKRFFYRRTEHCC